MSELVRSFVAREIAPNMTQWEQAGEIPRDLTMRRGELMQIPGFHGADPFT